MDADVENAAVAVSEELLERTGDAIASGDGDAFAACFLLPQTIETPEGAAKLETKRDLLSIFENVRRYMRERNVTLMERHCVGATWLSKDIVEATHVSRYLSGASLVQEPFLAISLLKRTPTGWKIADTKYDVSDSPGHLRALTKWREATALEADRV
ncbi:MAG: hypothetical protein AAFN79_00955 [Pseudomonadota bacterium]